jgi:hypothetical protein
VSRSRSKGTAWETAICRYLVESGFPGVERRALAGVADRGDIAGLTDWVIEAKNCARTELGSWVDEAAIEAANADVPYGVVWHHRRGKGSPADGFVTMRGADFVQLLRALIENGAS